MGKYAETETGKVYTALCDRIQSMKHGAFIGTNPDLRAEFGVSDITIRAAVGLLTDAGLVEKRMGNPRGGLYVVRRPVVPRLSGERYRRFPDGADTTRPSSTTDYDQASVDINPSRNTYSARRTTASPRVCKRLGLPEGSQVVEVEYVFHDEHGVLQMSTSWEPLDLVGGTDAEITGSGDKLYGGDVISRMDKLGYRVASVVEETTARGATPAEADILGVSMGAPVMVIERTHFAEDETVVETCDAVLVGPRNKRVDYLPVLEMAPETEQA